MLSIIHSCRRAAAWASAAAALTLLGIAAAPVAETPAGSQPRNAVERSVSGKIIDRLPGVAPDASRFAASVAPLDWPLAAMFASGGIGPASPAAGNPGAIDDTVPNKPVRVATARAAAAAKPPHLPRRQHGTTPVAIAVLPPPRPASLHAPQDIPQIAETPERRPSVASRMIALVGSLAQLARPL